MRIQRINSQINLDNKSNNKTSFNGKAIPELVNKMNKSIGVFSTENYRYFVNDVDVKGRRTFFKTDFSNKIKEIFDIYADKIKSYVLAEDSTIVQEITSKNIDNANFSRILNYSDDGKAKSIYFAKDGITTRQLSLSRKEGKIHSVEERIYDDIDHSLDEINVYIVSGGKRVKRLAINYKEPNPDKACTVYDDTGGKLFHSNPAEAQDIKKLILEIEN